MREIKPLYRPVNTRTHNVHHHYGSDARHDRNTKQGLSKSMKKNKKRGLDFTPLYMFLLSKVGKEWNSVYSEALSRIPKENKDAIFHLVEEPSYEHGFVRCDESSLYSALFVDENGLLQKIDPTLTIEKLYPSCHCCTHTFNGKPLTNKFVSQTNLL